MGPKKATNPIDAKAKPQEIVITPLQKSRELVPQPRGLQLLLQNQSMHEDQVWLHDVLFLQLAVNLPLATLSLVELILHKE